MYAILHNTMGAECRKDFEVEGSRARKCCIRTLHHADIIAGVCIAIIGVLALVSIPKARELGDITRLSSAKFAAGLCLTSTIIDILYFTISSCRQKYLEHRARLNDEH